MFVVSSDFCHWGIRFRYTRYQGGPSEEPVMLDTLTPPDVLSKQPIYASITDLDSEAMSILSFSYNTAAMAGQNFREYIRRTRNTICGKYPILLLLSLMSLLEKHEQCHECRFTYYAASMAEQQFVAELGRQDPVAAAKQVMKFKGILDEFQLPWYFTDYVPGTGDDQQVPWARGALFNRNPLALGIYETGYVSIPHDFGNFVLNRTTVLAKKEDAKAVVPFYIMKNYNATKIKRVVIVIPGQWRNSWAYINLMGNALNVAKKYPELGVKSHSVLLLSPVFFNQMDRSRGSVKDNEINFENGVWASAGSVQDPKEFRNISSFDVLDFVVDMVMDKRQFPNVETVVIAGHSMGGQMALHYAVGKKPMPYDDRIRYWVGDPGAYTYMSSSRPFSTKNCNSYNEWPYSVTNVSTLPSYMKKHAGPDGSDLVKRFRSRKVHFAVAENDNGQGVDNCQANTQGPTRIARASEWIIAQGNSSEGWPSHHAVDYMPGISHQDYPAMAYYFSLKHIFSST
ncbi:hypothetical protein MNAN1_002307 [Malassezia nana]|uniref:Uncharacterized protein n=1 Tax=Malassezia nana TaxID=180528 RepID=A0AAF0EM19_9BASI|nr:hypothetical protein MNAN1_002307 [Malassezia nana]